jgi:hypothetical protein
VTYVMAATMGLWVIGTLVVFAITEAIRGLIMLTRRKEKSTK